MYTKTYSLKSHDYSLDHREDELIFEFCPLVTFTIANNAGDAEVPTKLNEIVGIIPFHDMSIFDAGDAIDGFGTDGIITSGAVTVRIQTVSIPNGAFRTSFFLVGRRKAVDA